MNNAIKILASLIDDELTILASTRSELEKELSQLESRAATIRRINDGIEAQQQHTEGVREAIRHWQDNPEAYQDDCDPSEAWKRA